MLATTDNYQILIDTKGDTKGVKDTENALKDMGGETDKSHASFLKLTAAVAAGEAAFNLARIGIEKLTGFVKESVNAYAESENIQTLLTNTLKSTHEAAGLQLQDLNDQAKALQKMTRYSDEAVGGVQQLLLTFSNVKGPIFQQATESVLDMATAMGMDLHSASIMLGKALNDPIKGITAMSKAGVSFTQVEKDQIKAMVQHGQTAAAQQKILETLAGPNGFRGAAVAAGTTFAGSLDKLKNSFNDIQESIGKTVVEGLTPFIQKAAEFLVKVDWELVIKRSKEALKDLWQWLVNTGHEIYNVYDAVASYLGPKLDALWHTIKEDLAPELMRLWHEVIEPLVPIVGTVLVAAFGAAVDILNGLLHVIKPVIDFMLNNKDVVIGFATAFGILAIAMNFSNIAAAFSTSMVAIRLAITTTSGTVAALGTSLMAFGGWAAFAAAAAIAFAAVIQGMKDVKKAADDLNNAVNGASSGAITGIEDAKQKMKEGKITADQYAKSLQIYNSELDDLSKQAHSTASRSFWDWVTGKKATGGPVSAGNAYMVGENSDGTPNSTTELFVPDQPGRIVNAKDTQALLNATGPPKGNVTMHNQYNIYNQVDLEMSNRELGWKLSNA